MHEDYSSQRYITLVFVLLIILNVFFITTPTTRIVRGFKAFLFYVVHPTATTASVAIESNTGVIKTLARLVKSDQENMVLLREVERYQLLEDGIRSIRDENERLRQLLEFSAIQRYHQIRAQVIVREPYNWYQWVLINKGRKDGIAIDVPVIALNNKRPCVVGRIAEMTDTTAKVMLITQALFAVPACGLETNEDALIEGQNGPTLQLNYITQTEQFSVGQEMVVSPLSSVFPPHMLIGQIEELGGQKDEQFFSALVHPAALTGGLREVVVLIPLSKTTSLRSPQ